MKKSMIIIFFTSILVKITGFIRELVLSYYFGVSLVTDAFIIALTIPGMIFSFIGIGITTSYIPVYNMIMKEKNNDEDIANKYTNSLVNLIILICIIICFFAYNFMENIIKVLAFGFNDATFELAVYFSRINLISIFFMGLIYIFNGFCQSNNKFFIPSFVVVVFNSVSSIFIYFANIYDMKLLVIGNIIALGLQLMLLILFSIKKGFKYKLVLNIKDKYLRTTIKMALPLLISTSMSQINVLVDKTLASGITIGGITALNYANKLNLVINGTVVMAISTVIFPKVSKLASEMDNKEVENIISQSLRFMIFLLIPITAGTMSFSGEIVEILFGRGQFDAKAINMTSRALYFYALSMPFVGIREIISRCFYAYGDTKNPTINAIYGVGINILLNIILSKYLGLNGLALATSTSIIFTTIILAAKTPYINFNEIATNNIKFIISLVMSAIVMAIISKITFSVLIINNSLWVALLIAVFFGGVTYFFIICIIYKHEFYIITNKIKNSINRNNKGR